MYRDVNLFVAHTVRPFVGPQFLVINFYKDGNRMLKIPHNHYAIEYIRQILVMKSI